MPCDIISIQQVLHLRPGQGIQHTVLHDQCRHTKRVHLKQGRQAQDIPHISHIHELTLTLHLPVVFDTTTR